MRGSVEHLTSAGSAAKYTAMAMRSTQLLRDLRELIAALDRRVPQAHRAGEASIARDSAALRARALERIDELERTPTDVEEA